MRTTLLVTLAAGGLLINVQLGAHHAFNSEFDAAKPIKIHVTNSMNELRKVS